MDAILLTGYIILLLIALIYASIIIYHILKYHREDLSPRQASYAKKALWVYITVSGFILIISIVLATILFISV